MSPHRTDKLAIFEGKRIRKTLHEGEWWFSIIDVVEALVGGDRPRKYWSDLKTKLTAEGYAEVSEKIGQLKMTAPDGKERFTDCANTETLFRIIQSIPSPKVLARKDRSSGTLHTPSPRRRFERLVGPAAIRCTLATSRRPTGGLRMRLLLAVFFSAVLAAPAVAQQPGVTTQTGTVTKGAPKVFQFTPSAFSQVVVTLSWDAPAAHLVVVMVCGSSADSETFGIGAGLLDRFARFESGVIAGEQCGVAVTSADESANFRLHLFKSGDQGVSPAAAAGPLELAEARLGTFLGDRAIEVAARMSERLRTIRR